MTESFPLYYTYDRSQTKDLTAAQKRELLASIKELSEEQMKMVVMLIDEHRACELRNSADGAVTTDIPYGGLQTDDGVHFSLDNIPNCLRQIIYRFVVSQSTPSVDVE